MQRPGSLLPSTGRSRRDKSVGTIPARGAFPVQQSRQPFIAIMTLQPNLARTVARTRETRERKVPTGISSCCAACS